MNSCVSKKRFNQMQSDLNTKLTNTNKKLDKCNEDLKSYTDANEVRQREMDNLKNDIQMKDEQITTLKTQVEDYRVMTSKQLEQVGDLAVLSKEANENISKTLSQLEKKDQYIQMLQAARTKADSLNLALAVNLKSVLQDGLSDGDIDIKVDKTVVFVSLSDKMLYKSGSSNLTSRAKEVLGKIAKIIEANPNLEVMVEGHTDNVPISNDCVSDNWDLSVKRATSVVRLLQKEYGVNPNNLIAAGRGEYNASASNDTKEGRSTNRKTKIIILPKLDQFYDLLNPEKAK